MVNLKKNIVDIKNIKLSCFLVSNVIDYITSFVILNISTIQLNKLAFLYIKNFLKAFPATLNYFLPKYFKFPGSICISINDIVCHGIPSFIKLNISNIINIDISLIKYGYFGDMSKTFTVLLLSNKIKNLLKISFRVLWKCIKILKIKILIKILGKVIYNYILYNNYIIVKEYCGHGLGFFLHEFPEIINFFAKQNFLYLKNKTIFTVEPIVNLAGKYLKSNNFWESKTLDGSYSSQWEYAVLLLNKNYIILN